MDEKSVVVVLVVVVESSPDRAGFVVVVVDKGAPNPNDSAGPAPVGDAIEPNEEEANVDEFAPKTAVFSLDDFPPAISPVGFVPRPPLVVSIDDANAANEKGVDSSPFVLAPNPKGLGVEPKAPLVEADDATEPKEKGLD